MYTTAWLLAVGAGLRAIQTRSAPSTTPPLLRPSRGLRARGRAESAYPLPAPGTMTRLSRRRRGGIVDAGRCTRNQRGSVPALLALRQRLPAGGYPRAVPNHGIPHLPIAGGDTHGAFEIGEPGRDLAVDRRGDESANRHCRNALLVQSDCLLRRGNSALRARTRLRERANGTEEL